MDLTRQNGLALRVKNNFNRINLSLTLIWVWALAAQILLFLHFNQRPK